MLRCNRLFLYVRFIGRVHPELQERLGCVPKLKLLDPDDGRFLARIMAARSLDRQTQNFLGEAHR